MIDNQRVTWTVFAILAMFYDSFRPKILFWLFSTSPHPREIKFANLSFLSRWNQIVLFCIRGVKLSYFVLMVSNCPYCQTVGHWTAKNTGNLHRQMCLHFLTLFRTEILKPAFSQVSIEVTSWVNVHVEVLVLWHKVKEDSHTLLRKPSFQILVEKF